MGTETASAPRTKPSAGPLMIAGEISIKLKHNHTDARAAEFRASINPSMGMVGAKISVYRFADGHEWLVVNSRPYASLDHQGVGQVFACSLNDVSEILQGRDGRTKLELAKLPRIERSGTLEQALSALWAV